MVPIRIFVGDFLAPNLLPTKTTRRQENSMIPTDIDHDEVWFIDPAQGLIHEQPTQVTFWCALPRKAEQCEVGNPENKPFCPPYPTALFAHGYGGSRMAMREHMGRHTAMGMAVCALDGPGHGGDVYRTIPDVSAALTIVRSYFERYGIPNFVDVLLSGRDRDLNLDGIPDPGGDMWTADLFHTRDMVRQSVLETMQFVRILRSLEPAQADFDGDGLVDIGGADGILSMWGISLGGVISGVAAGAEPGLDAVSPNAGGAGLVDIAVRSKHAGVPDAVVLPMIGPLIVGCLPTDEHQNPLDADTSTSGHCLGGEETMISSDTMHLGFIVNDVANAKTVPFGTISGIRVGDTVRITNLANDEVVETQVNKRGFFRAGIPADAMTPLNRKRMLGQADDDLQIMQFDDPYLVGDGIRIEVFRDQGSEPFVTTSEFGQDVTFQGTQYSQGSPLVVFQEGYGHKRNNPALRRFLGLAQHGISQADPGVWGAHTFMEPLNTDYDPFGRRGGDTHVLLMPTIGDVQVPTNTGVAMGRVSGVFGSWLRDPNSYRAEHGWREMLSPDGRFGKTIDEFLRDLYVIEGDALLQRMAGLEPVNPNVLFDPDNLSDSQAKFSCGDSDWSGKNGESRCPRDKMGSGPECSSSSDCPDQHQECIENQCEFVFGVPNLGDISFVKIDLETMVHLTPFECQCSAPLVNTEFTMPSLSVSSTMTPTRLISPYVFSQPAVQESTKHQAVTVPRLRCPATHSMVNSTLKTQRRMGDVQPMTLKFAHRIVRQRGG